jgi:hypothetical protein
MRTALAPVVALLALLAFAAPAPAAAACPEQDLTRPFLPWLDPALYEPAPDGGLEAGADAWTLTGGAAVTDGGRPNGGGARSLALPAGATATTAPACVTIAHPTIRFFTRGSGLLTVTVLVDGAELPIGVALGGGAWAPSLPLPVVVNLLGAQQVQFRFASSGPLRIDDVYVDPYSKG